VDRSFWLSLLLLLLAVTLVMSGRAVIEAAKGLQGEALVAEIDALAGRPSSLELAERVTEAAGCVRGFRPEVRSCWWAWAQPERPDYLRVVAERVRADGTGEAVRWSTLAFPLWLLAMVAAWKATRPTSPYRPPPSSAPATRQPRGRLVS
jgi:hypothetical protein